MINSIEKYGPLKFAFVLLVLGGVLCGGCNSAKENQQERPNIVILMSDNHSWNHLGCYGDPVVKTPNIDSLAKQGIRFTNAFCSAPSCTPARASMLTGQDIWRLEEGANLWGTLPSKFKVYTEMLEEAGYLVGFQGKGWGPGNSVK
jgi:arylsulfatase A-like enzyme